MNIGGLSLRNPLVRLTLLVSLILLLTQPGWLEAIILFFLTGLLWKISIPPLLMLLGYLTIAAYIGRHLYVRAQKRWQHN